MYVCAYVHSMYARVCVSCTARPRPLQAPFPCSPSTGQLEGFALLGTTTTAAATTVTITITVTFTFAQRSLPLRSTAMSKVFDLRQKRVRNKKKEGGLKSHWKTLEPYKRFTELSFLLPPSAGTHFNTT